ncbi:MAG: ERF family protein [Methanobrevibacter sp.]|nr:ERF family protein [Methanobrevibacter sp.]
MENQNKKITVGSFNEVIKAVQEDKKLVPDLLKAENGNNFRAISESAILDVINPILIEHEWFYEIRVKKSDLQIREAFGSKGKKLQFIATIEVAVVFHNCLFPEEMVGTESVSMGIDDNDKAMGKAYTYAVKYALLKLFRLRYGDDSDFEASKPLHTEKPKEEEKIKPEKEDKKPKSAQKAQKGGKPSGMDKPMTEAQRDYILGMMKQKKVEERQVLETFQVEPSRDEFIPMPTARAIIKWLEDDEYLPF